MNTVSTSATPLFDAFHSRSSTVAEGGLFELLLTGLGCLIPVSVSLYLATQKPLFAFGSVQFIHADLVLLMVVALVGGRALLAGFHPFRKILFLPILLLLISTLLSAVFAADQLRAAAAVVQVVEFAVFTWCFSLLTSTKSFLRIIHFTLAWFAFESLVATVQFLAGDPWPSGTFLVHQEYAMFTGFSAAIAFGLLSAEISRRRRVTYFLLLVVLLWGTLLGQERAPWLAFILGCAAVVYYSGKQRKRLVVAFAVTVVAGVTFVAAVPQLRDMTLSRLAEAETDSTRSNTLLSRLALWQAAGKLFLDHPILGIGPKNFLSLSPHILSKDELAGEEALDPHNIWIGILAEQGILGFATYIYFSVAVLTVGIRTLRNSLGSRLPSLCLAYTAYHFFWLAMSYHFFQKGEGHIHFLLIGLMLGQQRHWTTTIATENIAQLPLK